MSTLKVPHIPDSNVVTIEISGYFYKKLQSVFLAKGAERSKEDFVKVLERIKTKQPIEDLYEAEIEVLASLVLSIERAAQSQNKLEYKDIEEVTTPPTTGN